MLAWFAVIASALVLVGSGTLYAAYNKLDSNIKRVPIPALSPIKPGAAVGTNGAVLGGKDVLPRPVKSPGAEKDLNFLVIGSDSREGATKEEMRDKYRTEFEAGQRSDTMLLINIPANREGAYVLSLPRDLYVDVPGNGKNRLNVAFAKGGPSLAIQTVEALTNIHIDHYLEVNFEAFLNMVDALGGVEMCIPKTMKSTKGVLNLKAGTQRLDGPTALAYVRVRSFDSDSPYKDPTADLGRIKRQQAFIGAMVRDATSSAMLLRPDKLARFLNRATSALTADEGLEIDDLQKLALRFRNLDPAKVIFATVPNYDPGRRYSGASVLLVDPEPANEIFSAIIAGSIRDDGSIPPAPSVSRGARLTVPTSQVRVRVLNGTGTGGKAREAAEDLKDRDFVVTEIDTASEADRGGSETVIRYGPKSKDAAITLQASVPGSIIELDENLGTRLTMIVGTSYSGTKAVTVARPRPSGSPVAAPPKKTAADSACV